MLNFFGYEISIELDYIIRLSASEQCLIARNDENNLRTLKVFNCCPFEFIVKKNYKFIIFRNYFFQLQIF